MKGHLFSLKITLVFLIFSLGGCTSSTQIVKNEDVKIGNYGELYFIPPEEDPRNIVPRAIKEFESLGMNVRLVNPDDPINGTQGSGFLVDSSGHILTCEHVIENEKEATIWISGERFEASVIAKDKELDLALLKLRGSQLPDANPLNFRVEPPKLGEDIFAMGFPMSNLLGDNIRLSKGLISSTKGLKGDIDQIQISTAIQPGNSGGPVFDNKGGVVGVVQKTLNPWKMVKQSGGSLPQNVNFAIRSNVVSEFLSSKLNSYGNDNHTKAESFDFSKIEMSVVKVKSGILPEELENKPKLIVRLDYISMWDLWYRFRYIVFSFYDFDSQDILFKVGQTRDDPLSNEETVILDTFKEIRATLR